MFNQNLFQLQDEYLHKTKTQKGFKSRYIQEITQKLYQKPKNPKKFSLPKCYNYNQKTKNIQQDQFYVPFQEKVLNNENQTINLHSVLQDQYYQSLYTLNQTYANQTIGKSKSSQQLTTKPFKNLTLKLHESNFCQYPLPTLPLDQFTLPASPKIEKPKKVQFNYSKNYLQKLKNFYKTFVPTKKSLAQTIYNHKEKMLFKEDPPQPKKLYNNYKMQGVVHTVMVQSVERKHSEEEENQHKEDESNQCVTPVGNEFLEVFKRRMAQKYQLKLYHFNDETKYLKQVESEMESHFIVTKYDDLLENTQLQLEAKKARIRASMIKLLKFLTKLDLTFDEILNNHVFSFAPFDKKCNRIYLVSKQLFDYAKQGDHVNVKYMLDKNRYLVFAYDNCCLTPLHWACKLNHYKLAKILIEKKSDIDATDIIGRTPLYFALQVKSKKLVYLLLIHQSSPWSTVYCKYDKLIKENPQIGAIFSQMRLIYVCMNMMQIKLRRTYWKQNMERLKQKLETELMHDNIDNQK